MGTEKVYTFEEMLAEKGFILYTNEGRSMLPLLRPRRDIIEIRARAPGTRSRKYDIVLYRRGRQYVLHRVLKVLPAGYLIAGDHNTFLERDVTDGRILGTVTRIVRGGREIRMEDPRYRLYVRLWCGAYPLRMALLRGGACGAAVLRKLRSLFRKRGDSESTIIRKIRGRENEEQNGQD